MTLIGSETDVMMTIENSTASLGIRIHFEAIVVLFTKDFNIHVKWLCVLPSYRQHSQNENYNSELQRVINDTCGVICFELTPQIKLLIERWQIGRLKEKRTFLKIEGIIYWNKLEQFMFGTNIQLFGRIWQLGSFLRLAINNRGTWNNKFESLPNLKRKRNIRRYVISEKALLI